MYTATRVQILDEIGCISHSTNTLGKGKTLVLYIMIEDIRTNLIQTSFKNIIFIIDS